jgi:lipoprotein-anchoring transpeptidase ErfK/SrfK
VQSRKKHIDRLKRLIGIVGAFLVLLTSCFVIGYQMPDVMARRSKKAAVRTEVRSTEKMAREQLEEKPIQKAPVQETPSQPVALNPAKMYRIHIDKSEHRFDLLDGSQVVRSWPCAVGKGGLGQKQERGDNMTPVGTFTIDEIDDASDWTHDFGDGNGPVAGAYGPWFFSLETEKLSGGAWDGIGIHGTNDPASLGTDASEGCIRLSNQNLEELYHIVHVGTVVEIQN